HTIKGMSATLGFDEVTRLAHELEDRLDAARTGREAVDRALIDELFAAADALESAVEAAAAGGAGRAAPKPAKAAGRRGGRRSAKRSGGSGNGAAAAAGGRRGNGSTGKAGEPREQALVMRVVIRPDAPLGGARAALVRRNAADVAPVLHAAPADPAAAWAGEVRPWSPADADRAALERAARAAGDVLEVRFEGTGGGRVGEGGAAGDVRGAAQPTLMASHHVRVALEALDDLSDGVGELAVLTARLR